jgi:hypothetical protein
MVKPGSTQKCVKYEVYDKGLGDPQFPPQAEPGRRRFRFFRRPGGEKRPVVTIQSCLNFTHFLATNSTYFYYTAPFSITWCQKHPKTGGD